MDQCIIGFPQHFHHHNHTFINYSHKQLQSLTTIPTLPMAWLFILAPHWVVLIWIIILSESILMAFVLSRWVTAFFLISPSCCMAIIHQYVCLCIIWIFQSLVLVFFLENRFFKLWKTNREEICCCCFPIVMIYNFLWQFFFCTINSCCSASFLFHCSHLPTRLPFFTFGWIVWSSCCVCGMKMFTIKEIFLCWTSVYGYEKHVSIWLMIICWLSSFSQFLSYYYYCCLPICHACSLFNL